MRRTTQQVAPVIKKAPSRIKLLRLKTGLTQEEVCTAVRELGERLDAPELSRIENGKRRLAPGLASALSVVYGAAIVTRSRLSPSPEHEGGSR